MERKLAIKKDVNGKKYATKNWSPTDGDIWGFINEGEKIKQEIDIKREEIERYENKSDTLYAKLEPFETKDLDNKIVNMMKLMLTDLEKAKEETNHWTVYQIKLLGMMIDIGKLKEELREMEKKNE